MQTLSVPLPADQGTNSASPPLARTPLGIYYRSSYGIEDAILSAQLSPLCAVVVRRIAMRQLSVSDRYHREGIPTSAAQLVVELEGAAQRPYHRSAVSSALTTLVGLGVLMKRREEGSSSCRYLIADPSTWTYPPGVLPPCAGRGSVSVPGWPAPVYWVPRGPGRDPLSPVDKSTDNALVDQGITRARVPTGCIEPLISPVIPTLYVSTHNRISVGQRYERLPLAEAVCIVLDELCPPWRDVYRDDPRCFPSELMGELRAWLEGIYLQRWTLGILRDAAAYALRYPDLVDGDRAERERRGARGWDHAPELRTPEALSELSELIDSWAAERLLREHPEGGCVERREGARISHGCGGLPVADMAPDRLDELPPAPELDDEPAPHAVRSDELPSRESCALSGSLDDPGDIAPGERPISNVPCPVDGSEQRARGELRQVSPALESPHPAQLRGVDQRKPRIVVMSSFGTVEIDAQGLTGPVQILHSESSELSASSPGEVARQEHRPIPYSREPGGTTPHHGAELGPGQGATGSPGGAPEDRAERRQTQLDRWRARRGGVPTAGVVPCERGHRPLDGAHGEPLIRELLEVHDEHPLSNGEPGNGEPLASTPALVRPPRASVGAPRGGPDRIVRPVDRAPGEIDEVGGGARVLLFERGPRGELGELPPGELLSRARGGDLGAQDELLSRAPALHRALFGVV